MKSTTPSLALVSIDSGMRSPSEIGMVDSYINQRWFATATTPEPSSIVLLGGATVAPGLVALRRRKSTAATINKQVRAFF